MIEVVPSFPDGRGARLRLRPPRALTARQFVALFAVLRFKSLLAAHPGTLAPGPLMRARGLGSLLLAGFMLYRRRDIKRLFAYSSIEHMGIIAFAFGLVAATSSRSSSFILPPSEECD